MKTDQEQNVGTRKIHITVEGATWGDRPFAPAVAQALAAYAREIETGRAGNLANESFVSESGVTLTVTSV